VASTFTFTSGNTLLEGGALPKVWQGIRDVSNSIMERNSYGAKKNINCLLYKFTFCFIFKLLRSKSSFNAQFRRLEKLYGDSERVGFG
jgi:hypothetical protein